MNRESGRFGLLPGDYETVAAAAPTAIQEEYSDVWLPEEDGDIDPKWDMELWAAYARDNQDHEEERHAQAIAKARADAERVNARLAGRARVQERDNGYDYHQFPDGGFVIY